jgi:membrane protein implicated in regulation of membrane protease activity
MTAPHTEPHTGKIRRRKLVPATIVVVAVLLAAPLVALLWVGSYNSETPRLWGFPFFYWYQLMWVILAAGCTSAAYLLLTRTGRDVELESAHQNDGKGIEK